MTPRGVLAAAIVTATAVASAGMISRPDQAPIVTGRISGVVVAGDGTPVRRALVTLRGGGPGARSEITGDDGRFVFDAVPAGRFRVSAERPGFVRGEHGARRPGAAGTAVALEPGAAIDDVTIRLARGAVITGAVRDANSAPVVGIEVRAVPVGADLGMTAVFSRNGRGVMTDDRGAYRVYGLPPGRYLVLALPARDLAGELERPGSADIDAMLRELERGPAGGLLGPPPGAATPPPGARAPASRPAARTFTYAAVFHPGTTSQADAIDVRVAAGEERDGVDITLDLVPSKTIEGTVTGATGGERVRLIISGAGMAVPIGVSPPRLVQAPGPDGRFQYVNVTPGRYRLTAQVREGTPMFATADVDVSGEPVGNVTLTLRPAPAVAGRVTFDGDPAPGAPDAELLPSLRVSLQPEGGGGVGGGVAVMNNTSYGLYVSASGQVDREGTFRLTGVLPGRYRPTYTDASGVVSSGWWLRSVLLDGRDLLDEPLVVADRDVAGVVFAFTNRHSELSGTLETAAGQPATGFDVVVFPADRGYWQPRARRIRTTTPASDGGYAFADLPAGTYRLAVLTDLDAADLDDPVFLEQLVAASVEVTVADGQVTVMNLRAGDQLAGRRSRVTTRHPTMKLPSS